MGGYSTPIYFRVCPKQGPEFSKPYDMVFMCCSFCLDIYIKLSHHNYSEYTLQFCAAQQSTINIIIRPTDVTCVHRASKSGTARESSWYSNTPSHRLFMHNKSNSHTLLALSAHYKMKYTNNTHYSILRISMVFRTIPRENVQYFGTIGETDRMSYVVVFQII